MSELRQAAQAVVDRWDTPLWKDAPHTAEFIDRLRVALARSGQAASGSSQGARSDDQTEVEQFNAWFAALTFEKLGSDSMEWAAWKARATLVGQPEAPTAAPTKAAEDAHPVYWPEFPPFPTWIDANDLATLHEWAQTVRRDAFAAGLQRAAIAAHPPARSGAGSEEGGAT